MNTIKSYTLKTLFYNYSIILWLITDFFTVELLTCSTAPLVRENRGIANNCQLQPMSYLRTTAVSPTSGGSVVSKSMWRWHFMPKQKMATCEICACSRASRKVTDESIRLDVVKRKTEGEGGAGGPLSDVYSHAATFWSYNDRT